MHNLYHLLQSCSKTVQILTIDVNIHSPGEPNPMSLLDFPITNTFSKLNYLYIKFYDNVMTQFVQDLIFNNCPYLTGLDTFFYGEEDFQLKIDFQNIKNVVDLSLWGTDTIAFTDMDLSFENSSLLNLDCLQCDLVSAKTVFEWCHKPIDYMNVDLYQIGDLFRNNTDQTNMILSKLSQMHSNGMLGEIKFRDQDDKFPCYSNKF